MIDPGTPVSRGTDWLSLDVPQIWAMVADHETEAHQRVVSGWRKTAELSQLHLHRLQAYRRELAATWSPTGSAAAREYLDRLDFLIDTIRRTHDTASANYTTFAAATSAIGQSRRDLQQVYEDYTAKAQIRLDYDRVLQERKSMGGGDVLNSVPPVSDQELQQLRGRARLIMYGLSSELRQAQTQIRMPPRYKTERRTDLPEDNSSTALLTTPLLGGIAPAAISSTAPPTAAGSIHPSPIASAPGSGPVLGSAGPLAPAQPSAPTTSPSAPLPAPGLGNGGALPPVLTPGGRGPTRPPLLQPGLDRVSPERIPPGRAPAAQSNVSGRTPPSNGVIGGNALSGNASNTYNRANRVNPVGGVIGGPGTTTLGGGSTRGTNPTSRTMPGHPAPTGGRLADRHQIEREPKTWDPDHPWETEQGVEPILLPPAPRRIDPGPAIGRFR